MKIAKHNKIDKQVKEEFQRWKSGKGLATDGHQDDSSDADIDDITRQKQEYYSQFVFRKSKNKSKKKKR